MKKTSIIIFIVLILFSIVACSNELEEANISVDILSEDNSNIITNSNLFSDTNSINISYTNNSIDENKSIDVSDESNISSIDVSNESDLSEDTQSVKIPIDTSGDTSILPYHIGDYLFSNTGAKTEDFVVYDGIAEESLITNDHIGCKIHCLAYHGYTEFRIYNLGSEEDRKKFCERYCLSNESINGKTPVCEGYNQIQMIWDLGITPEQIKKEVGSYEELANELREFDVFSEKEISRYKTFYIGPESKMTDEDLDLIQMAWKSDFCVYTQKCFYTIDWLNEHSAEDYLEHKLPVNQLEEIYAQKDNGYSFVEFLDERINKYKKILSD